MVHKPPGWEVEETVGSGHLQLAAFARSLPDARLARDKAISYGFLHRLDVPRVACAGCDSDRLVVWVLNASCFKVNRPVSAQVCSPR